ncbi:hypothetical protein EON81_28770 [bacterium]|nr:MAG: hypothetical protein EON81_28770 [bacterium]
MGRPFDPETLAAIRRHLSAPEPREHVAFVGGLAFEDGGRMIVASDEQIIDAIAEMEEPDERFDDPSATPLSD